MMALIMGPSTSSLLSLNHIIERTNGSLSLKSIPSGAVVKIDGKYMGETPLTLEKEKPGSYKITFSAEGYESQIKTSTISAGKTITYSASLKHKQVQQTVQQPIQQQSDSQVSKPTPQPSFPSSQTIMANGVTFTMIRVEGGTFTMGATSEQGSNADSDEKPTHQVTLSSYYIGETEVTQALWQAVMGSEPTYNGGWEEEYGRGGNYPAYRVSWEDCQTFINKLNSITGKSFRLPTEAEWEYAARGGKKSRGYKYSGSNTIDNVAWYYVNSGSKTHPVKTKSPNELGIYDMSGNVWEWCQDWYGSYPTSSQTNPKGPSSGTYRVDRGASWVRSAGNCCVSYRDGSTPDCRNDRLGLRLVLSPL